MSYGNGYGLEIIGANPNYPGPGVPPYGQGFPPGDFYYPVGANGCGPNAFAALALAQQAYAAQAAGGGAMVAPGSVDQGGINEAVSGRHGGWGGGGWGPGWGDGPMVAPLAVQQNHQPLIGVQPRFWDRGATELIGFDACEIDPCDTQVITCSPCIPLKIIKWVIPSSIAFQVEIDQITFNGKETIVNCGSISGAMFTEEATGGEMIATETIQPGCCVQIQVTNISNAPVRFKLQGYCRVLRR